MNLDPPFIIESSFEDHNKRNYFEVGKPVKGKLRLKANTDVPIKLFGYEVILAVRGKTSSSDYIITRKKILGQHTFKAGNTYEYPIEFINTHYETYEGENATFQARFIPVLNEDKHIVKKIGGTLKSYFTMTTKRPGVKYLKFQYPFTKLTIVDELIRFQRSSKSFYRWSALFIFVLFTGHFILKLTPFFLLIAAGIPLVLFCAYYILETNLIGRFTAEFNRADKSHFDFILRNNKKWKYINKAEVRFEIIEEVFDDRGRNHSSFRINQFRFRKSIYSSKRFSMDNPTEAFHATFKYPPVRFASFSVENVSLKWQLITKVKTILGLKFTFKQYFDVKKVAG